tara:strand:- start:451 stop:717 length:267 start_codon:yes stop_codon:yes gene_type:complete
MSYTITKSIQFFQKLKTTMSAEEVTTPSKDDEDTSSDTKEELELSTDVRDIGSEAVWSLSTAKPGNGIDQVRDSNVRRYLSIRTSNNE